MVGHFRFVAMSDHLSMIYKSRGSFDGVTFFFFILLKLLSQGVSLQKFFGRPIFEPYCELGCSMFS